eukprot:TRINITY_DN4128_c0_g1_i1.p1 TRINITY_DN4128_c0_g1~~TRINITY_DN4128_c0_g1_i1.p1  ORF type:complete len:851 (-),score=43.39 TRINITY_DN4128_c0_g1_i1:324-2876(-)
MANRQTRTYPIHTNTPHSLIPVQTLSGSVQSTQQNSLPVSMSPSVNDTPRSTSQMKINTPLPRHSEVGADKISPLPPVPPGMFSIPMPSTPISGVTTPISSAILQEENQGDNVGQATPSRQNAMSQTISQHTPTQAQIEIVSIPSPEVHSNATISGVHVHQTALPQLPIETQITPTIAPKTSPLLSASPVVKVTTKDGISDHNSQTTQDASTHSTPETKAVPSSITNTPMTQTNTPPSQVSQRDQISDENSSFASPSSLTQLIPSSTPISTGPKRPVSAGAQASPSKSFSALNTPVSVPVENLSSIMESNMQEPTYLNNTVSSYEVNNTQRGGDEDEDEDEEKSGDQFNSFVPTSTPIVDVIYPTSTTTTTSLSAINYHHSEQQTAGRNSMTGNQHVLPTLPTWTVAPSTNTHNFFTQTPQIGDVSNLQQTRVSDDDLKLGVGSVATPSISVQPIPDIQQQNQPSQEVARTNQFIHGSQVNQNLKPTCSSASLIWSSNYTTQDPVTFANNITQKIDPNSCQPLFGTDLYVCGCQVIDGKLYSDLKTGKCEEAGCGISDFCQHTNRTFDDLQSMLAGNSVDGNYTDNAAFYCTCDPESNSTNIVQMEIVGTDMCQENGQTKVQLDLTMPNGIDGENIQLDKINLYSIDQTCDKKRQIDWQIEDISSINCSTIRISASLSRSTANLDQLYLKLQKGALRNACGDYNEEEEAMVACNFRSEARIYVTGGASFSPTGMTMEGNSLPLVITLPHPLQHLDPRVLQIDGPSNATVLLRAMPPIQQSEYVYRVYMTIEDDFCGLIGISFNTEALELDHQIKICDTSNLEINKPCDDTRSIYESVIQSGMQIIAQKCS